jgi:hypothetical protein
LVAPFSFRQILPESGAIPHKENGYSRWAFSKTIKNIFNSITKRFYFVLTNFENNFGINFKIVMADDISHGLCTFPVDFRIFVQERIIGDFI